MSETSQLDLVRKVLDQHRAQLLTTYHAVGVGIGKQNPTDSDYVIVLYLASRQDMPRAPVAVEGVPVKFEVTGQLRPLKR